MERQNTPRPASGGGNSRNRLRAFLPQTWRWENDRHGRWKRRWIAASGAAFAVVLATSVGEISWRTAVMIAATTVMLAMSGDMLDRVQE